MLSVSIGMQATMHWNDGITLKEEKLMAAGPETHIHRHIVGTEREKGSLQIAVGQDVDSPWTCHGELTKSLTRKGLHKFSGDCGVDEAHLISGWLMTCWWFVIAAVRPANKEGPCLSTGGAFLSVYVKFVASPHAHPLNPATWSMYSSNIFCGPWGTNYCGTREAALVRVFQERENRESRE
jgi:hypothetical protein